MNNKTTIIPIASGKGGVGKSIFAANLAIALARRGFSTVAVDLDLGGANLYTCLGMPNKFAGIGDFLKTGDRDLSDFLVPTSVKNLTFLPGDGRTPFMADISYRQRVRLFNEIRKISADYVIVDLGAGTMFNMLNFYGLAFKGIIITSFETPSIMNFMMFLRNFMFRVISGLVRKNKKALLKLVIAFHEPMHSSPTTVTTLFRKVAEVDPALAMKVRKICMEYRPRIVFNMGDHPDELKVLNKLDNSIKKGLSLNADFWGFIFSDDMVRASAKKKKPLLLHYPESVAARGIYHIAKKIEQFWDQPMDDSGDRLIQDTKRQYELWKDQLFSRQSNLKKIA